MNLRRRLAAKAPKAANRRPRRHLAWENPPPRTGAETDVRGGARCHEAFGTAMFSPRSTGQRGGRETFAGLEAGGQADAVPNRAADEQAGLTLLGGGDHLEMGVVV